MHLFGPTFSDLAGRGRRHSINGMEILIGLGIIAALCWWLVSEEVKESEEGYRNDRNLNHERFHPEVARRQADFSELSRLHPDWSHERIYEQMRRTEEFRYLKAIHPDWSHERIYEKIDAKAKAEESAAREAV